MYTSSSEVGGVGGHHIYPKNRKAGKYLNLSILFIDILNKKKLNVLNLCNDFNSIIKNTITYKLLKHT